MTAMNKAVLALGALCLATVLGTSAAHHARAQRHYCRLLYAGRGNKPEQVIAEYYHLPRNRRTDPLVKTYYEDARQKVKDSTRFDFFPTTEPIDVLAYGVFVLVICVFIVATTQKRQKLVAEEEPVTTPALPTASQIAFIQRINQGIVPVGLTRETAAAMIKESLAKLYAERAVSSIDISPVELMSRTEDRKEEKRLERDRQRAQAQLVRKQEQEHRRKEREEQMEQKALNCLYEKRLAEENRLNKAREEARAGVMHKTRSEKMQTIQEFQNLVNEILSDQRIDPQEVRQLKAWLMANRRTPSEFAPMMKLLDESLVDGMIDADETQAIYESIIDCLITLRARRDQ